MTQRDEQTDLGRAHRDTTRRAGTMRASSVKTDIVVEDLSTTGCLIVADRCLPMGLVVDIDIDGLAARRARIIRVDGLRAGCEFLEPMQFEDLRLVRFANPATRLHTPVPPPETIAPAVALLAEDGESNSASAGAAPARRSGLIFVVGGVLALVLAWIVRLV